MMQTFIIDQFTYLRYIEDKNLRNTDKKKKKISMDLVVKGFEMPFDMISYYYDSENESVGFCIEFQQLFRYNKGYDSEIITVARFYRKRNKLFFKKLHQACIQCMEKEGSEVGYY